MRKFHWVGFLCVMLAALSGCDNALETKGSGGAGGEQAGGSGGSGAGGAGGSGGAEPGTQTLKAEYGPVTIQSGEEAVQCVVVDLGNPDPVYVRRFRTNLHAGSHHMIVYTTTSPPSSTPFPCQSFGVAGGSAIFIAQQPESELVLPTDPSGVPVGVELSAHQSLQLEVHYINTNSAPIDVYGEIELDVLPISKQVYKGGFHFQGAFDIPEIPANGEADTGVRFEAGIPGSKVFALTTHQHQLGTRMQVWHADNISDLSTPIADSTSWHDPPLEMFDPPLEFPLSSNKGFAYQCHWKNPTPDPVYGGLGAEDEMCFFWSYYYVPGQ